MPLSVKTYSVRFLPRAWVGLSSAGEEPGDAGGGGEFPGVERGGGGGEGSENELDCCKDTGEVSTLEMLVNAGGGGTTVPLQSSRDAVACRGVGAALWMFPVVCGDRWLASLRSQRGRGETPPPEWRPCGGEDFGMRRMGTGVGAADLPTTVGERSCCLDGKCCNWEDCRRKVDCGATVSEGGRYFVGCADVLPGCMKDPTPIPGVGFPRVGDPVETRLPRWKDLECISSSGTGLVHATGAEEGAMGGGGTREAEHEGGRGPPEPLRYAREEKVIGAL
jgi:hypothetical protein